MSNHVQSVAIIGGGPAGLRAAEVAVEAGARVTVYEHKRSVGRKFLLAGKSGLNLTNTANSESFSKQYSGCNIPHSQWAQFLREFDNKALRLWAQGLDVETFEASGGKVFPVMKKAAPLLRRCVLRLKERGVQFAVQHRWVGLRPNGDGWDVDFEVGEERRSQRHEAVVLALGGASWPETGSDGGWVQVLENLNVSVNPLVAANCGWECEWSPETLSEAEGQPLHHLTLRAGEREESGELMVTRYGFEGAPLYRLGPELRGMLSPELTIDFKPVFTLERMVAKMESARRNFYREAQLRWKLPVAACAILRQLYGEFSDAESLARAAKSCRIPLRGSRPIEEAISTAGGIAWSELDERLMLKSLPGVHCAGDVLDWEAPTGGYLLQGCFATGTVAGKAAANTLKKND